MGSIGNEPAKANTEYWLSRGGIESIRLTAQHYMLVGRQGWLLHPSIVRSIEDIASPRIADVACGTGVWCMDLAQQIPHAEIVGLDVSNQQFSPSWTWPKNVSLGMLDLLEDVPDELRGTFDVVHVRLLLAAGPRVDRTIFIDKFRALLKPNGWLQWDDLAWPNMLTCIPSSDQASAEVVDSKSHPMIQIGVKYMALQEKLNVMNNFERIVMDFGGFGKARVLGIPIRSDLLQIETDLCISTLSELVRMLIKIRNYTDPLILAELNNAVDKLHDGVRQGTAYAYNWNIGIAQRA